MPRSKYSQKIRGIFFAVLLLYLGSSGLFIYSSWGDFLKDAKLNLLDDSYKTSSLVQESLKDANLLLNHIKIDLVKGLPIEHVSNIRTILDLNRKEFSKYHSIKHLGLTIAVDSSGKISGWSGPVSGVPADLSDGGFFKALMADPSRSYALNDLTKSRVSGRPVYQIAIPVRSPKGEFVCILSQQIDAQKQDEIRQDEPTEGIKVVVLMRSGAVLFQRPLLPLPNNADSGKNSLLLAGDSVKTVQPSDTEGKVYRIPGGSEGVDDTSYVGILKNGEYGITTVAMVTEKSLLSSFLKKNWGFFPLTLLGSMILFALFYGICLLTMYLEKALLSATSDPLTGLLNRRAFENDFLRLVKLMQRENKPLVLLFIDIDHFKQINDKFGHLVGDMALKTVAECIRDEARRPFDLCCRWGGEEFVLALPNSKPEKGLEVANRLRQCVESLDKFDPAMMRKPVLTISTGIANLPPNSKMDADELVKLADEAMLRVKAEGRNGIIVG